MWKQIQTSEYFFSMIRDAKGYELYITDYLDIWRTELCTQTFLHNLKNSNIGLELEGDADFVKKGLFILDNVDKLRRFSLRLETDQNIAVTMGVSFGYPFYFACRLYKGSKYLFFKMVTQPLLKTVRDLRSSESELRDLMMKKDFEILSYQRQSGKLVIEHLNTGVFKDREHMMKHNVHETYYGEINLPISLIERNDDVSKNIVVNPGPDRDLEGHTEPNVKTETVSDIQMEPAHNMKTETPLSIETELTLHIKAEPDPETEPLSRETENKTAISEEPSTSVTTASTSCKQEVKKEKNSTQGSGIPRKRSKFNY